MKPNSFAVPVSRAPWVGWTLAVVLALTLAWDASGWDRNAMRWLADANGFPWRHHWWLERVLHDAARQLATALYIGLWLLVWWPLGPWRGLTRAQRLEVALGVTWGLLAVNAIKRNSLTSCPWDLQEFGGTAQYVSHWLWGVVDGGGGHCFPGGHASAALAFLALPLPWLAASDPAQQARGRRGWWAVVGVGLALGLTQTLRGAHYPSHTLWTLVICGGLAVLNHAAWRCATGWWVRRQSSSQCPSPSCSRSSQADAGGEAGACCHSQAQ